jgi:hypothetical protein
LQVVVFDHAVVGVRRRQRLDLHLGHLPRSVVFGALELPPGSGSGCKAHGRSPAATVLKRRPVLF